jgi:hypothetical protein
MFSVIFSLKVSPGYVKEIILYLFNWKWSKSDMYYFNVIKMWLWIFHVTFIIYIWKYLEFLNLVNSENWQGCVEHPVIIIVLFCICCMGQEGRTRNLLCFTESGIKMKLLKNASVLFHFVSLIKDFIMFPGGVLSASWVQLRSYLIGK